MGGQIEMQNTLLFAMIFVPPQNGKKIGCVFVNIHSTAVNIWKYIYALLFTPRQFISDKHHM